MRKSRSRLRDLQEQKAAWIPVEGQKPAPGQQVRIEVAPLDAENAGTAQPYMMVLGEGRAIPDVEERVMTLLPGETVDTEVRFPDDFSDEARRGQTRKVRIALHEVKRQELPAAGRLRSRGRWATSRVSMRCGSRSGPTWSGMRRRPPISPCVRTWCSS